MTERLTKADWIRQGLRTLTTEGAGALKVGPMAATLKVSRGSFYWHFRDIAEFRAELLASWRQRVTDRVIRQLDAEKVEPDRLKLLLRRGFDGKHGLERAIRAWAAADEEVAAVGATDDARRVDYIAGLLAKAGVDSRQALRRATFLYWAYLGQAIVMDPRHASLSALDMDEISELFER